METPKDVHQEAWELWTSHRKEIAARTRKNHWTEAAQKISARKLAQIPLERQLAVVELSVQNGWIGLFPDSQRLGWNQSRPEHHPYTPPEHDDNAAWEAQMRRYGKDPEQLRAEAANAAPEMKAAILRMVKNA